MTPQERPMTPEAKTPIVSVCVPTYNRAALLSQSLQALLSQITPAMRETVEVVILDNASPDQTPAVAAQAQADFPHVTLRYVRRPENIGCDANFCDAPRQARGTFVYLLSDDDVLLPGGVARLLGLIEEHPDLDAYSLNVYEFWDTPDEAADEEADEKAPPFFTAPDHILRGRDAVLPPLNSLIIFISCFAFRRENVLGRDYGAYYDTNMAQAYMFLDALAPGRGLYASQKPYLARRTDNHEGYDFFRVFVTNWAALMRHARHIGYSRQAVRQAMEIYLDFLLDCIVLFKSHGTMGQIGLSDRQAVGAAVRLVRAYWWNKAALTILLPRLLMPRALYARFKALGWWIRARLGRPAALPEARPQRR